MTMSTPSSNLGRHVFGVAALSFGFMTLAWHDYNDGVSNWHYAGRHIRIRRTVFGWRHHQFRRTAKAAAAVLGAAYFVFVLRCVPAQSSRRRSTIPGATSSSSSLC